MALVARVRRVAHLRPLDPPGAGGQRNARQWWQYALECVRRRPRAASYYGVIEAAKLAR